MQYSNVLEDFSNLVLSFMVGLHKLFAVADSLLDDLAISVLNSHFFVLASNCFTKVVEYVYVNSILILTISLLSLALLFISSLLFSYFNKMKQSERLELQSLIMAAERSCASINALDKKIEQSLEVSSTVVCENSAVSARYIKENNFAKAREMAKSGESKDSIMQKCGLSEIEARVVISAFTAPASF